MTQEMIEKARDFALKKRPTSYPRFDETKEQQLQRLTVGKIGEIVGQHALSKLKIPHHCPDKLKVVERVEYRDVADCIIYPNTNKEAQIDFKSAWQRFHTRILIPQDQYFTQKKDIYIGVKISLEEHRAEVYGYVTRQEMETKHPVTDFGEGPAYWVFLNEMHPLQELA